MMAPLAIDDRLALDDLEGHARAAWHLADELCTCSGNYHQVHPLLHAIGLMRGIADDRDALNPLLLGMIAPGSRILIAGAADAMLLQYFFENSTVRPLSVTVVDRCAAPLALIERMMLPEGISVETRQADLADFAGDKPYDLILSHAMLPFVSDAIRIAILERLGASLTSDGRLVVVVRLPSRPDLLTAQEHSAGWLEKITGSLGAFPDLVDYCGDALPTVLRRNAEDRSSRKGNIREIAQLYDAIDRAGLRIDQHVIGNEIISRFTANSAERGRQGHIFLIARP